MDIENSAFLTRINFTISCVLVFSTSLFAVPLYHRILNLKWLSDNYILRLIVVNGIVSIAEFISYVLALSLGRIPNLNVIIDFLNESHLNEVFAMFFLYATSAQFSTSLSISLNRLFSITNAVFLKQNEQRFFRISVVLSLVIPIFVSIPIYFGNVHYAPTMTPSGTIYTTTLPEMILLAPFALFLLITAVFSNLCNAIIAFHLMKLRTSNGVTQKTAFALSRAEQGLPNDRIRCHVTPRFTNCSLHVLAGVFIQRFLGAFLILIVALFNVMPFWFLIFFVPSLRKLVIPTVILRLFNKVAMIMTTINFVLNPLLVYFSPLGWSWTGQSIRIVVTICALLPHPLGLAGCLAKVVVLMKTYMSFLVINMVLWTIAALIEIYVGVEWSKEPDRSKNHTAKSIEEDKEYGRDCLIVGILALLYCVFQIAILCVYFKARKEVLHTDSAPPSTMGPQTSPMTTPVMIVTPVREEQSGDFHVRGDWNKGEVEGGYRTTAHRY